MVKGYANTDLPLDTAWTDIDYMVSRHAKTALLCTQWQQNERL
jgi:hypothetical protein